MFRCVTRRLGRLLSQVMPDEPQALGLVSNSSTRERRRAWCNIMVSWSLWEDQDRSLWDNEVIVDGCTPLTGRSA
jgi:predicted RNA polymerase sigma factor